MASRRSLWNIFGVEEDEGGYVVGVGIAFFGVAVLGCVYCKFYDPLKLWCIKKWKKCLSRSPAAAQPPPRDPAHPDEREHWYLHRTLAIDKKDEDELGPIERGDKKGLRPGWYGAGDGGFVGERERRKIEN